MPLIFGSHREWPLIAVGVSGVLCIYDVTAGEVVAELLKDEEILDVAFEKESLAAVSDGKRAVAWRIASNDGKFKIEKCAEYILPKRISAAVLTADGANALVADKTGDVWSLALDTKEDQPITISDQENGDVEPILGHFSVLTDIDASKHRVVTADRDNKIRVSRLPNSFVAESFLLGHIDSVTRVNFVGEEKDALVISSSLDGTIRLWDYVSRTQLDEKVVANSDDGIVVGGIAVRRNTVAMIKRGSSSALFFPSVTRESKFTSYSEMDCEGQPTSVTIDCFGKVWISCDSEKKGQTVLVFDKEMQRLHDSETSLLKAVEARGTSGNSDGVVLGESLLSQRKKEMVDNWKGKKRRVDSSVTRLLR